MRAYGSMLLCLTGALLAAITVLALAPFASRVAKSGRNSYHLICVRWIS